MGNNNESFEVMDDCYYRKGISWLVINTLAILIGFLAGLGAVVFRYLLYFMDWFFNEVLFSILNIRINNFDLGHIFVAMIGALIVGLMTNKLAEDTKGSGIPELMNSAAFNGGKIAGRIGPVKSIVSSITISVNSGGREGPITQIGGWIGSQISKVFKLNPSETRLLLASGVAAGVGATFNAPLGGAIFSLEILFNGIGIFNSIPIFLASVVGEITMVAFFGNNAIFILNAIEIPFDAPRVFLILLFSIIIGMIGYIWVYLFYGIRLFFKKLTNIKYFSKYMLPILGASMTGIIIMVYPNSGILGTGYLGIKLALGGHLILTQMIILGIFKMLATAFTLGSDNSGGIFGPSLFIGAMFGGVIGTLLNTIFPLFYIDPNIYIILGMAAMFASSSQSPINMSVIIVEMTKNFWLIPHAMFACGISFIVSMPFFKKSSIYTKKLEIRGIPLKVGTLFVLKNTSIGEILDEPSIKISRNLKLNEFYDIVASEVNLMISRQKQDKNVRFRDLKPDYVSHKHTPTVKLKNSKETRRGLPSNFKSNVATVDFSLIEEFYFPVIDRSQPIGVISLKSLKMFDMKEWPNHKVDEVMEKEIPLINYKNKLQSVLDIMYLYKRDQCIVILHNNPENVIGVLTKKQIFGLLQD
ncbi:MAG: chloride channel protein, partial [Promethearchaeota archaeon]